MHLYWKRKRVFCRLGVGGGRERDANIAYIEKFDHCPIRHCLNWLLPYLASVEHRLIRHHLKGVSPVGTAPPDVTWKGLLACSKSLSCLHRVEDQCNRHQVLRQGLSCMSLSALSVSTMMFQELNLTVYLRWMMLCSDQCKLWIWVISLNVFTFPILLAFMLHVHPSSFTLFWLLFMVWT